MTNRISLHSIRVDHWRFASVDAVCCVTTRHSRVTSARWVRLRARKKRTPSLCLMLGSTPILVFTRHHRMQVDEFVIRTSDNVWRSAFVACPAFPESDVVLLYRHVAYVTSKLMGVPIEDLDPAYRDNQPADADYYAFGVSDYSECYETKDLFRAPATLSCWYSWMYRTPSGSVKEDCALLRKMLPGHVAVPIMRDLRERRHADHVERTRWCWEKAYPEADVKRIHVVLRNAHAAYENVTNVRVARADDRPAKKKYEAIKKTGCCGFFDEMFDVNGTQYRIGFNYGH